MRNIFIMALLLVYRHLKLIIAVFNLPYRSQFTQRNLFFWLYIQRSNIYPLSDLYCSLGPQKSRYRSQENSIYHYHLE